MLTDFDGAAPSVRATWAPALTWPASDAIGATRCAAIGRNEEGDEKLRAARSVCSTRWASRREATQAREELTA